jgi:hypothetical protein
MALRISRTLTDRPVAAADVLHALNREVIPVVRAILRRLTAAPMQFVWVSGATTLDVSQADEFVGAPLTQNSTLMLTGGFEGASGTLYVQQDGTGGYTLNVLVSGRTLLREDPSASSDPDPGASRITRYRYRFVTIGGTPYVVLERLVLL